ncbi:ubiquinol oxidase subunit II [Marinivivus vitaminiproducens]|uniref:ubiquinol oxidase subunit II n=1 Tax=Marinivivus vitaminiproducens TaxID=3035935 RepID=UPI0027A2578E|nr:ubiquinol oxidase subunit II [Geminicoccaceae bacterium SCSIO 64248]
MSRHPILVLLPLLAMLSGCNTVVLSPSGDVATQQGNLIIISTVLMLIIIVPVMILTVLFAWRYRHTNTNARYEPDWDHSTRLELIIWAAPLLIIICLGAITWAATHLLDPYRPLDRIAPGRPVAEDTQPLEVEVTALDWKWLFIYPQYGIATVNELAAPVDRPINFRITSASVMNSFYIPALAGQIYAMAGMETKLHAVINAPGAYEGFSANYSGHGFSGMRFRFHGMADADFDGWVNEVRAADGGLDTRAYLDLERPSENVAPIRYASVEPDLFRRIVNMCVEPGKMCMSEMMAIDAQGGLGMAGIENTRPLAYDKLAKRGTAAFGPDPSYVASICSTDEALAMIREAPARTPVPATPVLGAGLPAPTPAAFGLPPGPAGLMSRPSNS